MSDRFIPALGHPALTRYYDRALALMTRERQWRAAALAVLAPEPADVILDAGCGTGSLLLLMHLACPQARLIGLDPDPAVLALAQAKAAAACVAVDWIQATGDRAQERLGSHAATKAVSSLVLHQCPLPMKRAVLASLFRILRPGGQLVLVDYGRQPDPLMELLFLQIRLLDGFGPTGPNRAGLLLGLMAEAGFIDITEPFRLRTPSGAITLYHARRPER